MNKEHIPTPLPLPYKPRFNVSITKFWSRFQTANPSEFLEYGHVLQFKWVRPTFQDDHGEHVYCTAIVLLATCSTSWTLMQDDFTREFPIYDCGHD